MLNYSTWYVDLKQKHGKAIGILSLWSVQFGIRINGFWTNMDSEITDPFLRTPRVLEQQLQKLADLEKLRL